MTRNCYVFSTAVAFEDVECSLLLALWAVESLHGEPTPQEPVCHRIDRVSGTCVIETDTQRGIDLNRIFHGFLLREFSADQFQIECVSADPASISL